ncbi:transglycosylase SLT domain-containing protein [Rhodococcus sp. IEGM 1409]|uniref:transglycosylase SLT domain-containing protein n=1 Tax=Rhodococcus sp. IEGM 1409 TaxID=3047082 RepID=UPI0024B6A124|nr:transglycosylase SLT domain-containing protein [Rhodococcus sp. IEGM 1409]MDI9898444.1 transglycosylase SLT domain-containing protein [Rhodococcus sp. IEGM 1409]
MTAPYAKAVVTAELDWGNVGAEFEARVRVAAEKAAKAAQKQFDRVRLAAKVSFRADVAEFRRETQERLNRASFSANVVLRAGTAKFHADVRKATKNLPGAKVEVTPEVKNIQSFVQGLEERLRVARITAPVFLAVANEADFLARIATLTRPVTQTVNIITTGDTSGAGGGAGGIGGRNGRLGGPIRMIRMQIEIDRASVASAEAQLSAIQTRLTAARSQQAESIDRVRVADARLQEVNARSNSTTSQRLAAQAALARANNVLGTHTARVTQLIGDQANSHHRLRRAQDDQNSMSRLVMAGIEGIGNMIANAGSSLISMLNPAGLAKMALIALAGLSLVPLLGQLSQAAGIISLLPAVAAAAVAGIATMVIGFTGVFDAFSKGSKAAEIAAKGTAAAAKQQEADARKRAQAAKAVAAAERGVESALDGVDRAERGVTQSQRQAEKAQESLNRAREDAKATIDDLNFALKGTAIDERDAVLALARAREAYDKTFADPAASALDRSEAALGVDKALRQQEEVGRRNTQLAKDAAKANEKGIEGADQVVAAKEAVAEADQGIVDANKAVVDAQDQVTLAQQNLADAQDAAAEAMTSNADAVDEYADALANLSPNARAFVEQVRGLSDAWKELRLEIQDNLFAGLGDSIVNLANNYFPILKIGLGGIATEINGGLRRAIDDLSSDSVKLDWTTILDNTKASIGPVIDGLTNLFGALTNIASIGSEFLPGFSDSFADTMKEFRDWTESDEGENSIRNFMEKSIESLKQVKDLFLAVGSVIGGLFATSEKTGKSMIESMTDSLREFSDWMKTTDGQERMGNWWQTVKDTVGEIMNMVKNAIVLVDKVLVLAKALGLIEDPDAPEPPAITGPRRDAPEISGTALATGGLLGRGNVFSQANSGLVQPIWRWLKNDNSDGLWDQLNGIGRWITNDDNNGFHAWAKGVGWNGTDEMPTSQRFPGDGIDHATGKPINGETSPGADATIEVPNPYGKGGMRKPMTKAEWMSFFEPGTEAAAEAEAQFDETWRNENQNTQESLDEQKGFFGNFGSKISEVFGGIVEGDMPNFMGGLGGTLSNVFSFDSEGSSAFSRFGSNAGQALFSLATGDFTGFTSSLGELGRNIFGTTEDGKINFDGFRNKIGEVIGDIVGRLFPGLKPGLDKVVEWGAGAVAGFASAWDGLRSAAATPINFIIDTVLNNGLGKAWNAVHSMLGLPAWPTIDPIGEVGGKAGGNIADNMIHRRDGGAVFGAGGPREDKIPAWLSNNEHVWTAAEVNAAGGHKAVEQIRNGVLAGNYRDGGKVVGGKGPARFAIGGGVMFGSDADTWMSDVIQNTFPEATITSALRPGHSGFHGRGQAVDIDGPNKQQYANWIYEAYPQSSQLIYGPGPLLYNVGGQSITDQNQLANQVYAGDLPGHFDHVHWANSMPLAELSEDQRKSLFDRVKEFGGAVINTIGNQTANLFEMPVKAIRKTIPEFSELGMFGKIPLALYDKVTEAALNKVRGKSQSIGGGGDVPYDKSSGAEQWRPLVEKLFDEKGIDRSLVDKYLYQIQRESGGNPNAINDWDINAQNGVPSKGLAQVIDPTFESFKDPGFDNIWDPEANLRASLNYLLRDPKFGGRGVGALTGAGYDQGGIANGIGVMPKFTLQPERVLSPEMTADFERLISVLERPDFIDVLRQITSDAVTNAATAASVSSGATAPAPEVNIAAAASGPSTAFDPNNTGYDDTYYNDTVARGGKEGADAWLARQDFGPQIRTWGINALKEIGGEFASPLGLERRWGEAVDQGAKDAMRAANGGGNTYNITQEFHGYNGTPQQFLAEVEREARRGMTALTPV